MTRLLSRLSALLAELRRRRVFRVAAVYAVVAWLLIQIAVSVFPHLHLPEWMITAVIVLVLLGFPIALVLAWAFELTPDGGVRLTAATADPSPRDDARGEGLEAAVSQRAAGPIRSIAALPLANHSQAPDAEFFSDGMTEELIHALTRVEGLRVAARTSAFRFKGYAGDVREVGRLLGVDGVLEGSVRLDGRRLRLTVQLIDARDGKHLWSEAFRREMDDVFEVQEEVAHAVAGALRLRGPDAKVHAAIPGPADVRAYTLYLQGRFAWNQRSEEGLRLAAGRFEEAIRLDPGYARAHAGLADAYSILMDYGLVAPREVLARATAAAERAVQLEPELAEARAALALVRQLGGDWAGAEAEFSLALAIDPHYVAARQRRALLLGWMGRPAEALGEIERAREDDPLSLVVHASTGWILYYARHFDSAIEQLRRTLEMDAGFVSARVALGLALLRAGRGEEAVEELEDAARRSHQSPGVLPLLGLAYREGGREEEARGVLRRVRETSAVRYVSPCYLAVAELGAGDREAALRELERAADEQAAQLAYLRVEPLWDPLRADPRFQALLRRVGLGEGRGEIADARLGVGR